MIRLLTLLLLLAGPAGLAAQGAVRTGRPANSDAAIRLWIPRGSVRVTTWARDSVHVQGRVDAQAGRFLMGGSPAALKVVIEPPEGRAADGIADLDVVIPAGARLWVTSAAAEVEVTAGGGTVEVTSVSGRVRVAGSAASVAVETLDGNVELACQGPLARVRTASGVLVVSGSAAVAGRAFRQRAAVHRHGGRRAPGAPGDGLERDRLQGRPGAGRPAAGGDPQRGHRVAAPARPGRHEVVLLDH